MPELFHLVRQAKVWRQMLREKTPAVDALSASACGEGLLGKLGHDQLGNHPGGIAAGQQLRDRLPAPRTEIQRPVVDVHAHELVGQAAIQAAAERQGIVQGLRRGVRRP